jgi:hypothetical protein
MVATLRVTGDLLKRYESGVYCTPERYGTKAAVFSSGTAWMDAFFSNLFEFDIEYQTSRKVVLGDPVARPFDSVGSNLRSVIPYVGEGAASEELGLLRSLLLRKDTVDATAGKQVLTYLLSDGMIALNRIKRYGGCPLSPYFSAMTLSEYAALAAYLAQGEFLPLLAFTSFEFHHETADDRDFSLSVDEVRALCVDRRVVLPTEFDVACTVYEQINKSLGFGDTFAEKRAAWGRGLAYLSRHGIVVEEGARRVKRADTWHYEQSIIGSISELVARHESSSSGDGDSVDGPDEAPVNLVDEQRQAYADMCARPVTVLSGQAGSGKSFLIKEFVREHPDALVLTPTFCARSVLVRRFKAMGLTRFFCEVHQYAWRCLYFADRDAEPAEGKKAEKTTSRYDAFMREAREHRSTMQYLIIEESSVVDLKDLARIATACIKFFPSLAHIIFVGDKNQLASVGPGDLLGDLERIFSSTELTADRRTSPESAVIGSNCRKILGGDAFLDEVPGCCSLIEPKRYDTIPAGKKVYKVAVRDTAEAFFAMRDALGDAHVLAFTNAEIDALNSAITTELFPGWSPSSGLIPSGMRIICKTTVAEIDMYKNDFFVVESHDVVPSTVPKEPDVHVLRVREWLTPENKKEWSIAGKLARTLQSGYVTSVHKFQGSEHDGIVVHAIHNAAFFRRKALYTASSRARKALTFITTQVDMMSCVAEDFRRKSSFVELYRKRSVSERTRASHNAWVMSEASRHSVAIGSIIDACAKID